MAASKSLLLYQDDPAGFLLRLVFMVVPLALLVGSGLLWASGEASGGLSLLIGAAVSAAVFLFVIPRKYQVFEDHLRIVLGGPLGVNIGFDRIEDIEISGRTSMTMNFVTTIAMTYVIIVKKRGMNIAITPKSKDLFVENANRALDEWARTRGIQRGPRTAGPR